MLQPKFVFSLRFALHTKFTPMCFRWHVSSSEARVSVSDGNGSVKPGSLVISGYDVSGRVLSDGEPVQGVNFVLFQVGAPEVCNEMMPIFNTSIM